MKTRALSTSRTESDDKTIGLYAQTGGRLRAFDCRSFLRFSTGSPALQRHFALSACFRAFRPCVATLVAPSSVAHGVQSSSGTFRAEVDQWLNNTKVFLAPLAVTYLGPIILLLQQPGHRFALTDFVPSNTTVGIMALYAVNVIFDLARKVVAGKPGNP